MQFELHANAPCALIFILLGHGYKHSQFYFFFPGITFLQNPELRYSAAQNAVDRVFTRSVEAGYEKGLDSGSGKGASVAARLLVATNQIGCLMGKGGTIIAEMRKATGASIRILGGDQVPICASENDEVVQVSWCHCFSLITLKRVDTIKTYHVFLS